MQRVILINGLCRADSVQALNLLDHGTAWPREPVIQETARLSLANAILSVVTETSRNVEVLKKVGLPVMALNYKS
jgi:hypothetical protein